MLLYLYRPDINGEPRKAPWFIFSLKEHAELLQNESTTSFIHRLNTVPKTTPISKILPPATSIEQDRNQQLPTIQFSNISTPQQFSTTTIQSAIDNKVVNAPQKLCNHSKKNPTS